MSLIKFSDVRAGVALEPKKHNIENKEVSMSSSQKKLQGATMKAR